jgi:hypothetical protein
MNNNQQFTDQTREQKLEAAFCQFIALVADMRTKQKYFREHYGATNRLAMLRAQEKVDEAMITMGITAGMILKEIKHLSFVKEILDK